MSRTPKSSGGGWLGRLLPRRRPAAGDAQHALGEALLAALDPDGLDEAERWLAALVRANGDAVVGYLALARVYRCRGEVGRAIQVHQNLLLRRDLGADDRVTVLAELAEDFRKGGFLERALASYQEVLAHRPRHVGALRALVDLETELRDHAGAMSLLRRLRRADGASDDKALADRVRRIAEAAHEEGHGDAARKLAKRALRWDPENAAAGVLLGQLEAERGRDKAALAAWRRVLECGSPHSGADPDGLGLYTRVEATFAAQGRARDYELFLRGLREKRPHDLRIVRAHARHLAARGDVAESLQVLRSVLEADSENLAIRADLSRILLGAGREKDALEQLREVLDRVEERSALLERETSE